MEEKLNEILIENKNKHIITESVDEEKSICNEDKF